MYYLDLHCHSVSSDDARATVEQYLKWVQMLRKRGYQVDGIVLTEHRKFDQGIDYSWLSRQYGTTVLKGSELDTRYGHFLVYGVNHHLLQRFNFADVGLDALALMQEAERTGAIAVPAHPGRYGIGLVEHLANGLDLSALRVVEHLNGGSRKGENERADALVQQAGLLGTGGSDAHFVSAIATCLTEFPSPIRSAEELVTALHQGTFRAVRLEETRAQVVK
ncbi:MAG: PHP domain-containing protein [Chloroflexi bacterium]|nr:PHP domain-containing protein [Chloroflexota bacterium]